MKFRPVVSLGLLYSQLMYIIYLLDETFFESETKCLVQLVK